MAIQGSHLHSSNPRFRFFAFVIFTIVAFGVTFYWRQQTLKQAEYVSIPTAHNRAIKAELSSQNYQLEVQDTSPVAQ